MGCPSRPFMSSSHTIFCFKNTHTSHTKNGTFPFSRYEKSTPLAPHSLVSSCFVCVSLLHRKKGFRVGELTVEDNDHVTEGFSSHMSSVGDLAKALRETITSNVRRCFELATTNPQVLFVVVCCCSSSLFVVAKEGEEVPRSSFGFVFVSLLDYPSPLSLSDTSLSLTLSLSLSVRSS